MAGTTDAGASTGTNGGDGVKEKAQEVRDQAGEQVRKATGQARGRAREQVDQRSTQVGDQVHHHASDLREVAHQLRAQGKDGPARIADQVAERAERAGSWMKESDGDRILGDVEDFARSNPWAVAAGGLALGFVASRVLKASSSRRYEERDATPRLPPAGGTTAGSFDRPYVDEPRTMPGEGVGRVGPTGPVGTPVPDEPRTIPEQPRSPGPPAIDDPLRTPTRGGGL